MSIYPPLSGAGRPGWRGCNRTPLPPPHVWGVGRGESALLPTGRNLGLITKIRCRDQFSAEFKNDIFGVKKIPFFH